MKSNTIITFREGSITTHMIELFKLNTKPPTLLEVREPWGFFVAAATSLPEVWGKIALDQHSATVFGPPWHILQGTTSLCYASQTGQGGDCHDVNGLPRGGPERSMSGPQRLEHWKSQKQQNKTLKSGTNTKGSSLWPSLHSGPWPTCNPSQTPAFSHCTHFTCQQLLTARMKSIQRWRSQLCAPNDISAANGFLWKWLGRL